MHLSFSIDFPCFWGSSLKEAVEFKKKFFKFYSALLCPLFKGIKWTCTWRVKEFRIDFPPFVSLTRCRGSAKETVTFCRWIRTRSSVTVDSRCCIRPIRTRGRFICAAPEAPTTASTNVKCPVNRRWVWSTTCTSLVTFRSLPSCIDRLLMTSRPRFAAAAVQLNCWSSSLTSDTCLPIPRKIQFKLDAEMTYKFNCWSGRCRSNT